MTEKQADKTARQRRNRAMLAEGLTFFGGYYFPKDLPKAKALSAKTDETVSEVRAQVAAKGKE